MSPALVRERAPLPCMRGQTAGLLPLEGGGSVWTMSLSPERAVLLVAAPRALWGGHVVLTNRGHNLIAVEAAGYLLLERGIWNPYQGIYFRLSTSPGFVPALSQCLWGFKYGETYLTASFTNRPKAIRQAKAALLNHYKPGA